MIHFLQILICLSIYSFIYLFIYLSIYLLTRNWNFSNSCTFVMKSFLDFDLCNSARFRRQINKHVKKREIREKHRERITFFFFFFFFFFFCFRRFKSFSRKFFLIVRKQFAQKHNSIQYTHNMNNVDRNYNVSFSTRRSTKNIFSLKKSLKNRQLTFCKTIQHKIIEQNRKWLKNTIDEHFEIFDRIKKSRYQNIRNHLFDVLQKNIFRRFDSLYFQTFHDDNDENVETNIRFYIESFRSIFEFETKKK